MAELHPLLALYALVLAGGVLLSLLLAGIAWTRRSAPGARALVVLELAAAWWILCYIAPLPEMNRSEEIFLRFRMIFPGVLLIGPAMLAFALQYTGRWSRMRWRAFAPLLIEPAIVLAAVWWPGLHDAFFGDWRGRPEDGRFEGGYLFWAHSFYSYGLLLVTWAVFIRHYRRESVLYRRQVRILLLGTLMPLAANIVTVSGLFPANIDVTPLGLVFGGAVMALAIFRRGLLQLIPVAREKIFQVLHEGVLVVDSKGRIVDSNPSAKTILNLGDAPLEGKQLEEAIPQWNPSARTDGNGSTGTEIHVDGSGKYVELKVIPILDAARVPSGTLLVLRDVTAARLASNALEQANERLRAQLLEIESMQTQLRQQAIRDPLTGLFNRRYLEETLQRELSRSRREGRPLALIMIDIDHFKKVNDVHGHACGDAILRALGAMLLQKSRGGDAACRYGGEEFVVVLTGTTLEAALQRAEQWRQEFSGIAQPCNGVDVRATFSAGVALFPHHGSTEAELLKAADRALYAAKAAGRNNVQQAEGGFATA